MTAADLAGVLRGEADFWLTTPGASDPNHAAFQFVPLLLRLADAVEAAS